MIKRINSLIEIPNNQYEGYLWMSDGQTPIILWNEKFDFNKIEINPFIVEGLLFDHFNNVFVLITHIGEYNIQLVDLNSLDSNIKVIDKAYLPHRLEGVKKVRFKQLWQLSQDPLCENMTVLKPFTTVFCGFEKS